MVDNIYWTGGFDSTFLVCKKLIIERKPIETYYLNFPCDGYQKDYNKFVNENNYDLNRIKILNSYAIKKNSTAVFINQVKLDGLKNEKLFIYNYSLIEYCKNKNLHCIDLASKLDGKKNYWFDAVHTTKLGSTVIAETVIDDLIKIIKHEKLFL